MAEKKKKEYSQEELENMKRENFEQMHQLNMNPQLTVVEIYDPAKNLIQRETTLSPRQASSVELTMDSKGNIKPSVKIYHEDPHQAHQISIGIMTKIYNDLNELTGKE